MTATNSFVGTAPIAAPPTDGRARRWIGRLLCALAVPWLVRHAKARRRVTIVVYHDPDPDVLARHLDWMARRYNFVTLDAVADALESRRWHLLPHYPLVVTVDDGHRNNTRLADTFHAYGVRPTIYLCSAIVGTDRPYWWKTAAADRLGAGALKLVPDPERRRLLAEAGDDPDRPGRDRQAMTWPEVRVLTNDADMGAHTRTHPILTHCDDASCRTEITDCRLEIEARLHKPCSHFAYPNGDVGEREITIARLAGYRTARSIDAGWNGPGDDPFRLKAMPISDGASVSWLAVQITGIPALLRKNKSGVKRQSRLGFVVE